MPTPPSAPPRPPFPVAMAVIPLVLSGAMWLLTGSALVLVFAALGPLAAVANLADGWRQRRRTARRDAESFRRALAAWHAEVDRQHDTARARLARSRPSLDGDQPGLAVVSEWHRDADELPIVVGLAELRGLDIAEDGPALDIDAESREQLEVGRARAGRLRNASVVIDARGGVGIVGPRALARALARDLATQIAARLSPVRWSLVAPEEESWTRDLPHEHRHEGDAAFRFVATDREGGAVVVVRWAGGGDAPGDATPFGGLATVVRVDELGAAELIRGGPEARGLRVEALTQLQAQRRARGLATLAARHELAPRSALLPETLAFAELAPAHREAAGHRGLAAIFAVAESGPIAVDLDEDGPHALIAGTTGSGKSEALVSWVLALCAAYTAVELAFVLIDFKGGATFDQLAGLPHVAGVVTDLDARRAHRAMHGLRAELRRRERILAEAEARSIAEVPPGRLARLVVVVDEYAAVVTDHPELHAVFIDLAARGRSLGVHLILCTQRPTGVVREGILANVTLKLALRVTDRAESAAVLGSESAARLASAPRGRAILKDARGEREIQLALTAPRDVETVRRSASARSAELQPWSDPLPATLSRHEARRSPGAPGDGFGLVLGLVDRVERATHECALYRPADHGALLVIGAPRSGRTTVLATLAEEAQRSAPGGVVVVPAEPAEAWACLEAVLAGSGMPGRLVVMDDLDVLLESFPPEQAVEFLGRVTRLTRDAARTGTGVALAVSRLAGALHGVAGAITARLVLRQASREEHLLAGLPAASFDSAQPPGAGWWDGSAIQVARPEGDAERLLAELARRGMREPETLRVPDERGIAVVTPRVRACRAAWQARGWPVRELSELAAVPDAAVTVRDGGAVLIGDADDWNASWALLALARRELRFLVDRSVPVSELRQLTRVRAVPPPLASPSLADGVEEWWLVEGGEVRRVRLGED